MDGVLVADTTSAERNLVPQSEAHSPEDAETAAGDGTTALVEGAPSSEQRAKTADNVIAVDFSQRRRSGGAQLSTKHRVAKTTTVSVTRLAHQRPCQGRDAVSSVRPRVPLALSIDLCTSGATMLSVTGRRVRHVPMDRWLFAQNQNAPTHGGADALKSCPGRKRLSSVTPASEQNGLGGAQDDGNVVPERPAPHIHGIHQDPTPKIDVAPT